MQTAWAATQLLVLQASTGLHGPLSSIFIDGAILGDGTQIPSLLKDISEQKPVTTKWGPKRPVVVCARGDIFEKYYPNVPSEQASKCLDPRMSQAFLIGKAGNSVIFLCMDKFMKLQVAEGSSEPEQCPSIVANAFQASQQTFRRYQVTVFIRTMMFLYQPVNDIIKGDSWLWLNRLVRHRKDPSVLNLVFYIYST